MKAGHDPAAVEALEAANLTSHIVNHEDGDRSIVMHTNTLAASIALDALADAGLMVVPMPGEQAMDFWEWLDMGVSFGYCSDGVCATHDGLPSSGPDEDAEWDEGGDPCVPAVRLFI